MAKNDGKECEEFIKAVVKDNHWALHRLQDTKAAAKYLPPQPADFMGVLAGKALLLECKSSLEHKSFKDCNLKSFIKPTQYGFYKLWERGGGSGVFVFLCVGTSEVEVWDSKEVIKAYSEGWKENQTAFATFKKSKKETTETLIKFVS